MPITDQDPVIYPGPPPKAADVVVIGAGVMGVMAALFLRRAGLSVVVIEKGRVAGEQSSRNWGWIRAQGRDWAELPLAMEARGLWAEIAASCDVDIGLRQTGVTYLASDEAAMARHRAWAARAVAEGLRDCRVLSAAEVAGLIPGSAGGWVGAMTTPSDLRAEPALAVPAVARMAVREGVEIVENCAVRGLDLAVGRVAGVVTEAGVIATRQVVLAGGAWSRLMLGRLGVRLPQLSVRSTVVATRPLPQVFDGQAADAGVAFRRRLDGGYTLASGGRNELWLGWDAVNSVRDYWPALRLEPLGTEYRPAAPKGYPDGWGTPRRWALDGVSPFERQRVLNPAPNPRRVDKALRRFAERFPQAGRVEAGTSWAGMIDTMPDFVPVVDEVAQVPGLVLATGLSGHGFGIAPAFGRVVADLVAGRTPAQNITRFRLARFGEGPLTLGPTL